MDIGEIKKEIERLEALDTTYDNCLKLSTLYIIGDHLGGATARIAVSEFTEAFTAAPIEKALQILDEHMEVIKAVYPKEYAVIISRLKEG